MHCRSRAQGGEHRPRTARSDTAGLRYHKRGFAKETLSETFCCCGLGSFAAEQFVGPNKDIDQMHQRAVLPKGSTVTVLVNKGDNYLIKTPFGLLGWLKIKGGSQEDTPILGIYWRGDQYDP